MILYNLSLLTRQNIHVILLHRIKADRCQLTDLICLNFCSWISFVNNQQYSVIFKWGYQEKILGNLSFNKSCNLSLVNNNNNNNKNTLFASLQSRTAEIKRGWQHIQVTNVTGIWLACFVLTFHLTITLFCSVTKRSV